MPYKDLHDDPFDETTISKLEIFEDYAQAWIPTFVMQGTPVLCIFDFFAGTGYDKAGKKGSPIRLLEKINEQIERALEKKVSIRLFFNEYEPTKKGQKKFELLSQACNKYLDKNPSLKKVVQLNLSNKDFAQVFPELLPIIRSYPSLVYLDQNGMKFISEKYILELEATGQTDFLYFLSASYFWRFGDTKEFKTHLNIDMTEAKKNPYRFIHRNILEQLRKRLPTSSELKLYPFSLKKGANIHGIIFGAKHPLAVEKFLTIAWTKNELNGQANFDIDDDIGKAQLNIFEGKKPNKIESFKNTLRHKVLAGVIKNNFEALSYAYDEGHVGNHAAECLREMKTKGEIFYDGTSPLVTYDNVFRTKRNLEYKKK